MKPRLRFQIIIHGVARDRVNPCGKRSLDLIIFVKICIHFQENLLNQILNIFRTEHLGADKAEHLITVLCIDVPGVLLIHPLFRPFYLSSRFPHPPR